VPIILGRHFLATTGASIDGRSGMIAFEMIGFGMEIISQEPFYFPCCMIDDHSVKERFLASSTQHDLFDPF